MKEQIKNISVIVPIYNKEKCLKKCLDSILGQTDQELEVILVDDGSTDSSLKICREYAAKDARVQVYSKPNGGVSSARNLGMEKSTGDYLTFVDPDDFLHPECIERLKDALEAEDADLSYCYAVDVKGQTGKTRTISGESGNRSVVEASHYDWFDKYAHSVCWGTLYKREITKNVRFDADLKIGEDTLFLAKCIQNSKRVVCLDRALYYYVLNEDSVTNGSYSRKKLDELEAWKRVCEVFQDEPFVYQTAKEGYALRCRMIAIKYCKDEKFMQEGCAEVEKAYKNSASFLLARWRKEGRYDYYLKNLFSTRHWDQWIKIKQMRKTYEVEL